MKKVGLLGTGSYLPERVMTNRDWERLVDTSDEWITSRTGIKERRFALDDETTVDLSSEAAKNALIDARVGAQEISEIILATDTPEVVSPDTASYVQHRLGAGEIPAYDLSGSGCAGFIQGLAIALSRVRDEGGKILVIGAELLSRVMSWSDRSTCVLFGDGAGAAVIGETTGQGEILTTYVATDGSEANILGIEVGGTRKPVTKGRVARGEHQKLTMIGDKVFKNAVRRMAEAAEVVLEKSDLGPTDMALVIPHQANIRIIEAVAAKLSVSMERMFVNLDKYGNTGSASIPIALDQALKSGRISPGDKVLLTAFGAGFHWAAAVIRF